MHFSSVESSKDSWKAIGTSDILTSLAQMGESLVDSRMQSNPPLPRLTTSSADSPAVSRQTASAASGTTATSCGSNSASTSVTSLETAAAESHHPVKSKDTAALPLADTPTTTVADKDGRNVELHLKETSSSSSSCGSSSSSAVDTNFKLTPICDSEQQDSGLDVRKN